MLTIAGAVVLVAGGWYVIDVAVNPWRKCRSCKGTGQGRFRHGRVYGGCRTCDGGKKPPELRVAARLVRPDLARKVK